MSRTLRACSPRDTLEHAAHLLWVHDRGALPVIDADMRVVGMITDRDAVMCAYTQGRRLAELPVELAMARAVVTASPDEPVTAALARMRDAQVRRLPVVDEGGRLRGVLSISDVVHCAARGHAGANTQAVLDALDAIGAPRHADRNTLATAHKRSASRPPRSARRARP